MNKEDPKVVHNFTEDELKSYVIKLRKRQQEIEDKQFFCQDHNFKLEAEAKKNETEIVRKIILEIESEFNLGFI